MELGNALFGHSRGQFEIDRGWQEIFAALCEKLECEYHGMEYDNDTFSMFPYWWGDCECEYDETDRPCPCMENCPAMRPNFIYKPTGYSIQWYKYPMRDAYGNKKISRIEFLGIVADCIASVPANG